MSRQLTEALDWKIEIDRETCMGSGMCCIYAPNTFDVDDETHSIVKDPRGDDIAQIRNAIESCPTRSLRLVHANSSEEDGDEPKNRGGANTAR